MGVADDTSGEEVIGNASSRRPRRGEREGVSQSLPPLTVSGVNPRTEEIR